ncbi:phospholipase D-like domain-containing protein [Ideonella sp.]|uniref:phospholipase D-like domain-containing protein n=1 Tax=Ideonella sp. TaxID=1929293 RepID=UPI002B46051D|nr:phospholipase D-like domain-containing protein [Ideonella sp.]HJV68461.1 phospholipase D-like domain-containing protein [Ideonella sp.]
MTAAWTTALARYALACAGLALAAGCSVVPALVPDLALPRGQALRMEGARGPLTLAQSRAVLDGLRRQNPAADALDRHLAIEEAIVGSPLTTGNHAVLLQDGPATYQAMFGAIAAAHDHINMETYILDDDEVGQRFAQVLIDKQREGVQVHLIRDSVGTLGTPAAFFQRLSDSGVQVLEFNPLNPLVARKDWELNQRDHRKLLVVDGHTAFLGGINISSVYSGGSFGRRPKPGAAQPDAAPTWRDTDLQLQGPVVAELQKMFLAAWTAQHGPPLAERAWFPPPQVAGRQVVRAIGSSPDEPVSLIHSTLLSAIDNAETSVQLTNAYFVPDPQLLASLVAAARRGVAVRLILPGHTDSWLTLYAGRAHYARLLEAGVRIFERRGAILHAKTALVDGVWATVGSTNLDWRSFVHNHELDAVVLGTEFGQQVQAMFDRDLAESDEVLLAQWAARPPTLRLLEWFSGLWAYWL